MAGSALLEREIEKLTGKSQEAVAFDRAAEKRYDIIDRAPVKELVKEPETVVPEMAAAPTEAPVAETAFAPAPSASERIADYMAASQFIDELRQNSGDVYGYAPIEERAPTYEEELYRQGVLMEASLAPEREYIEMPVYSPSYTPVSPAEDEEDALPTRRTLDTVRHKQETENSAASGMFAALSSKTKIVLAAMTAAVVLLLAVICINTAILNKINAGVATREKQVVELSETLNDLENQISDITSPENIENWAAEHGMTPPES